MLTLEEHNRHILQSCLSQVISY